MALEAVSRVSIAALQETGGRPSPSRPASIGNTVHYRLAGGGMPKVVKVHVCDPGFPPDPILDLETGEAPGLAAIFSLPYLPPLPQ